MTAHITSIAHYLPPTAYANDWFQSKFETSDEWIRSRTGIGQRYFLGEGGTSDLIVPAALEVLQKRGIQAAEIDVIIVCTVTPDYLFPSTAAMVQKKIGAKNAWGFDLSAACSGFLYGLWTGAKLVEGGAKKVLVCGADKMSAVLNFEDRTSSILFGDGAGVVLLEKSDDPSIGILDSILHMDGEGGDLLRMPAGGSVKPATIETVQNREHFLMQDGKSVFKAAVTGMADVTVKMLEKQGFTGNEIDWFVPHQANLRIIESVGDRIGVPREKVIVNIDRVGNTTAGTLPICMSEWHQAGKLKRGDRIVLASFGAGYTWGSLYLRWGI